MTVLYCIAFYSIAMSAAIGLGNKKNSLLQFEFFLKKSILE